MKTPRENFNKTQKQTLGYLLQQHIELKKLIDSLFSKAWNTNSIEPLLEIRSLNSSCISKYNDLIINNELIIERNNNDNISLNTGYQGDLNLWEINTKLSKLIPMYQQAITNIHLNSFVRMLISINMEKLILAKDNLLHPVKPIQEALTA